MTHTVRVTRRIEFDAGHRIPEHESKCCNIHGHRYAIEATVEGGVQDDLGGPEDGMVLDFSRVKEIMIDTIAVPWDHSFLCYEHDYAMRKALLAMPEDHREVILEFTPTAENLAVYAFQCLSRKFESIYGKKIRLVHLRLFETPNCWADYFG